LAEEALSADIVITASEFTKQTLVDNGVNSSIINVVPYGLNYDHFYRDDDGRNMHEVYKILFVGSWNQRKGLSYLVEAFRRLRNGIPAELHICGRGIMDRNLIGGENADSIVLHENIPHEELVSLYQTSDVFVFPSLCEGFGYVILEAMVNGLPVITTGHTAGPDIIEHGKEGYIIPIRDIDSIVKHLTYLYKNPETRELMGKESRKKALQFTYQRFRDQIADIVYEQ
jgi:glycosyltransferase involved in cell wall biosynthesis